MGKSMLEINPEIVCNIILKAREFFAKEEVIVPEDPKEAKEFSDDYDFQILADYRNDLTFVEFKSLVNTLEPDQQAIIVALFWIGRGDYDIKEWDEAVSEATRAWNTHTAEYLLSKPLLASYLEDALNQFGYSCEA